MVNSSREYTSHENNYLCRTDARNLLRPYNIKRKSSDKTKKCPICGGFRQNVSQHLLKVHDVPRSALEIKAKKGRSFNFQRKSIEPQCSLFWCFLMLKAKMQQWKKTQNRSKIVLKFKTFQEWNITLKNNYIPGIF